MRDYQYDFFLSYKRDKESKVWHDTVKEKLDFWVRQELNQPNCSIFFDTQSIETGDQFKDVIESAIRRSKCLVAIWSPDYFHSKWCVSEFHSFLKREEQLGLPTGSLIIPARFHDGENYPAEAKALQSIDFSAYSNIIDSFWKTRKASEFGEIIERFSKTVAKKIKNVPAYRDDFPIVVVEDDQVSEIKHITRIAEMS